MTTKNFNLRITLHRYYRSIGLVTDDHGETVRSFLCNVPHNSELLRGVMIDLVNNNLNFREGGLYLLFFQFCRPILYKK